MIAGPNLAQRPPESRMLDGVASAISPELEPKIRPGRR